MKPHELRSMSREELEEHARELRQELFNLRFRGTTQQLDNPLRLRTARKDLARTLTVLRELDLGLESGTGEGTRNG
ncbi:MAG: 50S ribosomal protein L29 [Candidatus Aegiribacteria sp. MLS_C]|nr:MAG: 50S ribosomal protein L29 [Candidatus Aegiribacteria sp. MLS_C]